jgi:hypothetical protein
MVAARCSGYLTFGGILATSMSRLASCVVMAGALRVGGMTRGPVDPSAITAQMAVQVRAWRVDEERSWRAVAEAASDLWGFGWGSNQLFGEDLCAAAARVLGEDVRAAPWN